MLRPGGHVAASRLVYGPGLAGVAMECLVAFAALKLPSNDLGLSTLEELIGWTTTYFHFKQGLEVVGCTPDLARAYIAAFESFACRFTVELAKQDRLESRLPIEMRQAIASDKPHLRVIRDLLVD